MRPFSDKQIALLQNFAAQAVIAMENARLITETREALEQQTATAEVLRVINSSPGDLAPVFDAIARKGASRCAGPRMGGVPTLTASCSMLPRSRLDGQPTLRGPGISAPARRGTRDCSRDPYSSRASRIQPTTPTRSGRPEFDDELERSRHPHQSLVPLRKDGTADRGDHVLPAGGRPFSDKQIDLLENFAAQAVIAMENARLLDELSERTGDLQESLEYQTATSDVLKVISLLDLRTRHPILETVASSRPTGCAAPITPVIFRNEGGEYRWAAGHGILPPQYAEHERRS